MILYTCLKEEVGQDVDENIHDVPKGVHGEFLTICGYSIFELDGMFEKIMPLSIFYCLCFVEEISVDMVEEHVVEETDPDLEPRGWGGFQSF